MLVKDRRGTTLATRSRIGAMAAVALLFAALVVPVSGVSNKSTLSSAVVSPRTGTTATTITVTVVYRNDHGSRAEAVTAGVGTQSFAMQRQPGGNWGEGVTFAWSGRLPQGKHAVVISAKAKDHSVATLDAGSVTIAAVATPTPTPKPTPRPTPTPKPTPKPLAPPDPTATPTATATSRTVVVPSVAPGPATSPTSPRPSSSPSAAPSGAATPGTTEPPTTAAAVGGTGSAGPGAGNGPQPDPAGSDPGGDPKGGWSPLSSMLALAGLDGPGFPRFGTALTLVTTTGVVVTAAMGFGLFGRRRRDDGTPDELLAEAAATGLGVAPRALAGVGAAGRESDGLAPAADAIPDADLEALIPRWRRPSLIQARKADPIRDNTPAPRLTFDQGLVGPLDGRERRVVRYRVVRLLDSPDELRGSEIGYLDQGDEVQLLEKYGAYWKVLCPDGQQGWLHKMTLGDIVSDEPPPSDGPLATMPIDPDSWTMGESDIDGDVLDAYLASRRRREA